MYRCLSIRAPSPLRLRALSSQQFSWHLFYVSHYHLLLNEQRTMISPVTHKCVYIKRVSFSCISRKCFQYHYVFLFKIVLEFSIDVRDRGIKSYYSVISLQNALRETPVGLQPHTTFPSNIVAETHKRNSSTSKVCWGVF